MGAEWATGASRSPSSGDESAGWWSARWLLPGETGRRCSDCLRASSASCRFVCFTVTSTSFDCFSSATLDEGSSAIGVHVKGTAHVQYAVDRLIDRRSMIGLPIGSDRLGSNK